MQRTEQHASFGGRQEVWQHDAVSVGGPMKFAVYLPPAALAGARCPVLYWLSGLTCTEQNFIIKSSYQVHAAAHNLIVVAPDTSPRGPDVADDPAFDLGQGAGFYVNATQAPWAAHFRMFDYVTSELPALVEAHFPVTQARSISGHSMGGHGALMVALRQPGRFRSVSAFAPIVAPASTPWGQKAFAAYLGPDPQDWRAWDATQLVQGAREHLPMLVDQGSADEYMALQLRPDLLRQACAEAGYPLQYRLREGYDHSYYYVASFLGEHFAFHAAALAGTTV